MVTQTIGAASGFGSRPPRRAAAAGRGARRGVRRGPGRAPPGVCARSCPLGVFTEEDGSSGTRALRAPRSDVPMSLDASTRLFSGLHFRTWTEAFDSLENRRARLPARPRRADVGLVRRRIRRRRRSSTARWRMEPSGDGISCSGATGPRSRPSSTSAAAPARRSPHCSRAAGTCRASSSTSSTPARRRSARSRRPASPTAALRRRAASSSAVPSDADVYLLSAILHDWDDERAGAILRSCRAAARPDSRLLIVEP